MTEHEIQVSAFAQYAARGTSGSVMFAIPNGGVRDKVTAGKLKAEGVTAGAPDIFASAYGKPYFIEVKTGKGRLSDAQKAMHRRIEASSGIPVHTVYGLDELLALLEDKGLLRTNRAFIAA